MCTVKGTLSQDIQKYVKEQYLGLNLICFLKFNSYRKKIDFFLNKLT